MFTSFRYMEGTTGMSVLYPASGKKGKQNVGVTFLFLPFSQMPRYCILVNSILNPLSTLSRETRSEYGIWDHQQKPCDSIMNQVSKEL